MLMNKLSFSGQEITSGTESLSPGDFLEHKKSYEITGTTRGSGSIQQIPLKAEDVVEFVFEDDTVWLCDSGTIEDVFPSVREAGRSADGSFRLPDGISGEDSERGPGTRILLKALHVFTKKNATGQLISRLAKDLENKHLEGHSGLFFVDNNFRFRPYNKETGGQPYLLFIHGTNSSTAGSFGTLRSTTAWPWIRSHYGEKILGFQHESLTKSPLTNVLDLVNGLPDEITLHIITHSRGGIVGDILARFCNPDSSRKGFTEEETRFLQTAGREDDVKKIHAIAKVCEKKKIILEKYIRVACPAAGTTLASNRLDNFFNVSLNLLGIVSGWASNPVFTATKSLIASVINCKNDIDVLPGVEAMHPESPFIKTLNSPLVQGGGPRINLDMPLVIISGNSKPKLNGKGLFIIASKLFYQGKNDLVVDTNSMYKGTRRTKMVQYFFAEGTEVDHVHYFGNSNTAEAIQRALVTPAEDLVPGFKELKPETSTETGRNALLGLDGGQVFRDKVTGKKPILIVLPGIMGSNLKQEDNVIWINYFRFLRGELSRLDISRDKVREVSLIKTSYKKLVDYFSDTYDVVTFAFDWRLPLYDMADRFNKTVTDLLKHNQPIKIIGHSMGGVLVRDFIVKYENSTWKQLNTSPGFRMIFLGSPLGGSFRIPRVLFGQDEIIKQIAKLDIIHTKEGLLRIFSRFPGLLSLLPFSDDPENDFSSLPVWNRMKKTLQDDDWPVPLKKDLDEFKKYRDTIRTALKRIDYSNMVYIAGKDKATPCGYRIEKTANGEKLEFLATEAGDQSVTWETGIPPEMIRNDSVYYVPYTHGALSNRPELFRGMAEILFSGFTALFSKTRPQVGVRGAEKIFRMPESEDFDISAENLENTILGLGREEEIPETHVPLKVSVVNSDLKYASYPLLAGHFVNDGILYAEKAVDYYLDGELGKRHQLNIYPGSIGTSEILLTPGGAFPGAIIVGLGELDKFTAFQMMLTVEQAVAKYLITLSDHKKNTAKDRSVGISSLIMACGYGGQPIETAVKAIVEGVQNANRKISKIYPENTMQVTSLEFVELYEDKALNCLNVLDEMQYDSNSSVPVVLETRKVKTRPGKKKRLASDGSEEWWARINVRANDNNEECKEIQSHSLRFSVSTPGAREEEQLLFTSKNILNKILDDISVENNWTRARAKTIFELLIPNAFKQQFRRKGNLTWILDKESAGYPWELLQDETAAEKPICYEGGMIRQLLTQDTSSTIEKSTGTGVLVVADPDLQGGNGNLSQLPGARKEGETVLAVLQENGYTTREVINGSATQVVEALMSGEYRIIHLAGHGLFDEKDPANSGMLIGDKLFLTTREISQMSKTPELVFVNCCYLGKTSGVAENLYRDRYKLAANIGTQLIENGVKAVIAAGWKVNDTAALAFANEFYRRMMEGKNFGDAVRDARRLVFNNYSNTNTWGAYQCYGDPFYKLKSISVTAASRKEDFLISEEAVIELDNLLSSMETGRSRASVLEKVTAVTLAVDKGGLRTAAITEREAQVYRNLGEFEKACDKYKSLFTEEKAAFHFSAWEEYCNAKIKIVLQEFQQNPGKAKQLLPKINAVIRDIRPLMKMGETAERLGLQAAAFKCKSLLVSQKKLKLEAIRQAAGYYYRAAMLNPESQETYGISNWLQLEKILVMAGLRHWGKASGQGKSSYSLPTDPLRELTDAGTRGETGKVERIDYWRLAMEANLAFSRWFTGYSAKTGKEERNQVISLYKQSWNKAGDPGTRISEKSHLDFLIGSMTAVGTPLALKLKKDLEQFREEARIMDS